MANKLGLGLGLGIDFKALDADLGKVADRIEQTGKAHSLKLGATVADVASGKMDPEKLGQTFAQVGARLSSGIASGVRASGTLMTGLATHMNKVLDRLAGASITMFQRIDAAMKFPMIDTALKSVQLKLTNFTRVIGRGPLSHLDVAIGGGMGKMAQTAAKILKVLFDTLTEGLRAQLERVVAALEQVVAKIGQIQGEARGAVPIFGELAQQAQKAAAATSSAMPPRGAVPGVGRRIGFGTQFTTPPPAVKPTYGLGDPRRGAIDASALAAMKQAAPAVKAVGSAALIAGRTVLQFGAAFISVPLRGVIALGRLRNFLSSVGDVGKKSFYDLYESHGLLLGGLLMGVKAARNLASSLFRVADKATLGTLGELTRTITSLGAKMANVAMLGVFSKPAQGIGGLASSAGTATGAFGRLGAAVKSFGREFLVALGFVGGIYVLIQSLKKGIMAASGLNETVSRSEVVFGKAFGPVQKQADAMSRAFGMTRKAQLDVASGFGEMAQGAGYSEAQSAQLANTMTKMAGDLSSSVNISFEDAGRAIRSALAGQSEPLREFGVLMTEDSVKAYALSAGLAQGKGELSEHAKMAARAALVLRGLSYAQGDLERTSNSAANQFRKAAGSLSEIGERIGEAFLPTVQFVVSGFNEMLGVVLNWFEKNSAAVKAWATGLAKHVGNTWSILFQFGKTVASIFGDLWSQYLGSSMGTIRQWGQTVVDWVNKAMLFVDSLAHNWGLYWKIVESYGREALADVNAFLAVIPANTARILEWLRRNWWNLLKDLSDAVITAGKNIVSNVQLLAIKIGDAVGPALAKLPKTLLENWVKGFVLILTKAKSFATALPVALAGADWSKQFDSKIENVFTGAGKHANSEFKPLLDGFKAATEQLPELLRPAWADLSEERKKLWEEIAENDRKRRAAEQKASEPQVPGVKKPGPLDDAKKESEYKLASAVEINSKEAYSAIARNASGRPTGMAGTMKELLATNRKLLQNGQEKFDWMKRNQAKMAALTVK